MTIFDSYWRKKWQKERRLRLEAVQALADTRDECVELGRDLSFAQDALLEEERDHERTRRALGECEAEPAERRARRWAS